MRWFFLTSPSPSGFDATTFLHPVPITYCFAQALLSLVTRNQVFCELNFRQPQLLINRSYDLTAYPLWQWPYPFVTELVAPHQHLPLLLPCWLLLNQYAICSFGLNVTTGTPFPRRRGWVSVELECFFTQFHPTRFVYRYPSNDSWLPEGYRLTSFPDIQKIQLMYLNQRQREKEQLERTFQRMNARMNRRRAWLMIIHTLKGKERMEKTEQIRRRLSFTGRWGHATFSFTVLY